MGEAVLVSNKHILVCIDEQAAGLKPDYVKELEYVKQNFCGTVLFDMDSFNSHSCSPDTIVYLCGNIKENYNNMKDKSVLSIFVIKDFSYNYESGSDKYGLISVGQVPINIHNVGVYFRDFFDPNNDYFSLISSAHRFQTLTESNKASNAFRTGIYLTKVEEVADEVKFNLLRCSSNLDGPTDNFRAVDNEVVGLVNGISDRFFEEKAELNHVLAQIYENKVIDSDGKKIERKARIKGHSDKTKDMPRNGLIAFCTFYKGYSKNQFDSKELKHVKKVPVDSFDYCYNDTSVLTKIRFRLKKMVTDPSGRADDEPRFNKDFTVTLYPNSVLLISLHTNRLYTHEIVPSILPINRIPTRLGYVIRSSKTRAVFKNGQTYIVENGDHVKMEEPDENGTKQLKDKYYEENTTDEVIHYDKFHFSLNKGDYRKPIV